MREIKAKTNYILDLDGRKSLFGDRLFISKTISVSANGNVHPGCSMSFKEIDKHPMFQIYNCNHDFFKQIDEWCFYHDIPEEAARVQKRCENYLFCRDKGIKIEGATDDWLKGSAIINAMINTVKRHGAAVHSLLPTLSHKEIYVVATFIMLEEMHTNAESTTEKERVTIYNSIAAYARLLMGKEYERDAMSAEFCRRAILAYTNMDKERRSNPKYWA